MNFYLSAIWAQEIQASPKASKKNVNFFIVILF